MNDDLRERLKTAIVDAEMENHENLDPEDSMEDWIRKVLLTGHVGLDQLDDVLLLEHAKDMVDWDSQDRSPADSGTTRLNVVIQTILEIQKGRAFEDYELIKIADVRDGRIGSVRNAQILTTCIEVGKLAIALGPTMHLIKMREDGDYDDQTEQTGIVWRIL